MSTTVKFQRNGQAAKYIANALNYKGYLVSKTQVGVGEAHTVGGMFNGEGDVWEEYDNYKTVYKPYFDTDVVTSAEKNQIVAKKYMDVNDVIKDGLAHTLVKFGSTENYTVTDLEEDKKQTEREEERAIRAHEKPIEFYSGIFGIRMATRLPADIWAKIKTFSTYHKGDNDDMEFLDDQGYYNIHRSEVKGWTYKSEAITTLLNAGFEVKYRGTKLTSAEEIAQVDKNILDENNRIQKRSDEINKKYSEFQQQLQQLKNQAKYISSEEANEIRTLPKELIPGWQGADIYGGGRWLHIKGDDLYLVYNNGMDGDDWSRNNYGTGGAGAIAYLAKNGAEILMDIREFITSLGKDAIYINE